MGLKFRAGMKFFFKEFIGIGIYRNKGDALGIIT